MSRLARIALIVAAALASLGFVALAAWQFQRLGWKQSLIAQVERQSQAAPVPPPAADAAVSRADEYRRVRLVGRFEPTEALVQATTALGGGHWVLTPLRLEDGRAVLVNRGFVPPEQRDPARRLAPVGPVELVGLLRLTEITGGPLRANVPAEGRWYSRDVAGIAAQLGVAGPVAPYFVDEVADAAQPGRWPRPGLTVLHFANNHAVYAITWLALAAMSAAAAVYLWREERRRVPA
ncbi:SURF1 family protein [Roseateles sp. BYS87W]|uniref:SURF1-like protein n=1 Tax=Pelomonas baiyunensis TaxID=3299026 RepID=A0ABW7GX72_9BURK